jgi:membrane protease YdiL (CAAX protease family)
MVGMWVFASVGHALGWSQRPPAEWLTAVPESRELYALIAAWLAVAVAGGAVAWVVRRLDPAARRPLPPQRRRAVVWTGPVVAVAFLAFLFLPLFLLPYIDQTALAHWFYGADVDAKLSSRLAQSAANVLALPLQVAVWGGLLAAATTPAAALGLTRHRSAADYVAGYRTWLVLTPAVYAVSFVVLLVYGLAVGKQPDEHPILQTFDKGSVPVGFIVLLVTEAVVVAPVREELFFRGILQPWLADWPWGGDAGLVLASLIGVMLRTPSDLPWRDWAAVLSAAAPALFVAAVWPLYRAIDGWSGLARWLPVRDPVARRQAARAIVGTAAVFANFHANVWPTPLPLFALALGLGWLAYRTQGVVAPTIMHMMFNAVAFAALVWK